MLQTNVITDPAPDFDLATDTDDMLVRIETTPTEGWLLHGRPLEEWVRLAVDETAALEYLARKLATAEGLEERSEAWIARMREVEDEARDAVRRGKKATR